MKPIAGALWIAMLGAGCGVGPVEVLGLDSNPMRIACSAAVALSGTWAEGAPRDPDRPTGCWGVGTWTFTAAVDRTAEVRDVTGDQIGDRCGEHAGTSEPVLEARYSFRVELVDLDGTGGALRYTLLEGRGGSELLQLKITDDGAGECEGALELASPDGAMEWNLRPSQTGPVIAGSGEFVQFLDPLE